MPDRLKSTPELAAAALVKDMRGVAASKLLLLSSGEDNVPLPCSPAEPTPMVEYAYTPLAPGRAGETIPNQPSSGMAHALAPPPPPAGVAHVPSPRRYVLLLGVPVAVTSPTATALFVASEPRPVMVATACVPVCVLRSRS